MDELNWSNDFGNNSELITSVFLKLSNEEDRNDFKDNEIYRINGLDVVKGIGRMFYIVDPAETTYSNFEDVPSIYRNVSLPFIFFCF